MDMIKYLNIFAIFIPLVYAIFLLFYKICLLDIKKYLLKYVPILINLFSLIVFGIAYYISKNDTFEQSFVIPFLKTRDFSFDLSFLINQTNLFYFLIISFFAFIFSVYLNFYFKKFKQYIFTKQRFLSLFSLCIFNSYLLVASDNLFGLFVFLVFSSLIAYLFAYFDLIKTTINANIARFTKISLFGIFSMFCAILILFKFSALENGVYDSVNLEFLNIEKIADYIHNLNLTFDYKALIFALAIPVMINFCIFPFGSYSSFLSYSSNLVYLIIIFNNCILGLYLFERFFSIFKTAFDFDLIAYIVCAFGAILSLVFLLFEKSLKIIFGYLFCIINSIFVILFVFL